MSVELCHRCGTIINRMDNCAKLIGGTYCMGCFPTIENLLAKNHGKPLCVCPREIVLYRGGCTCGGVPVVIGHKEAAIHVKVDSDDIRKELIAAIKQESCKGVSKILDAFIGEHAVPLALSIMKNTMRSEPDYAWSWHCNVAVSMIDEGVEREAANAGAARFMRTAFEIGVEEYVPDCHKGEEWCRRFFDGRPTLREFIERQLFKGLKGTDTIINLINPRNWNDFIDEHFHRSLPAYPCCEGAHRIERVPGQASTLAGGICPIHGLTRMVITYGADSAIAEQAHTELPCGFCRRGEHSRCRKKIYGLGCGCDCK